jgi:hypothetical protein
MFMPDVVEKDGTYFLLLGSGDREKPLDVWTNTYATTNYFFMVKDKPSEANWLNGTCDTGAAAPYDKVICLTSLTGITTSADPSATDLAASKGWYLGLNAHEQVVTSAITVFGNVTFSTHTPTVPVLGACTSNLGKARVYNVRYLNAAAKSGSSNRNAIVAGTVNPHYINPKQGLDRLQKLMDEYCGGVTVNYMTNEKLLNIGLKKLAIMEEDLEQLAAEDIHELLRAWELKHRHRAAECVTQHTLFRKETRWPGYYYRGDAMKVDDENWHVLTVSRRDPQTGDYTMEKAPCYHLVSEGE